MAATAHSAPDGTWNTQHARYLNLARQLEQTQPHERDALEREIARVQDELLDTPAPTLMAVMRKLEMLWETEMHGLDQDSEMRRLIVEDLSGLIQAQRELLGTA